VCKIYTLDRSTLPDIERQRQIVKCMLILAVDSVSTEREKRGFMMNFAAGKNECEIGAETFLQSVTAEFAKAWIGCVL
jgi:hypothetical protein